MYDYAIIGAGSAGCVLAHRLTLAGARVLLLEAGGSDRSMEVRIPAAFSKLFRGDLDWDFNTEPEPHLEGRRLYVPRGKMLGGSSSMNAMLYVRGNSRDYDGWAAEGCEGWGWRDVQPVFRRLEDNERGASEHHGAGGPLPVSDLCTINPLSRAFVDAATAIGLPLNSDFNGAAQDGVGYYQVTQKRGHRASAAKAFLRSLRRRSNLEIRTGALITKVLCEGARAVGVEARWQGQSEEIRAGEVVLAAGAVNSPQLLMLSGIGPAGELRRHGIDVVADLPGVGENLQDHPYAPVTYHCREPVSLASAESFVNLLRFLLFGSGPLTSPVAEGGAFVRSRPELEAPDLQYHFAPTFFLEHGFANPEGHGISLAPVFLCPSSRGRVSLRSADPAAAPAILTRSLSDAAEVETVVAGVRQAREILAQPAFDRYRGKEHTPGEEITGDAELASFARRSVELLYHPVGTCKMGTDLEAVVDPRLRVHGIDGLRVVDASIMPRIPRGNTNAPTMMIADRAADFILGS